GTSWIFPKTLRMRLRPVTACAVISSLALSNRRARDDSPEGRHPSRPSGQASGPCFLCDSADLRTALMACTHLPAPAADRDDSGGSRPGIPWIAFTLT